MSAPSGYTLVWQKGQHGVTAPAIIDDGMYRYQQEAAKNSGYNLIKHAVPLTKEEYEGWTLRELAELYPCPAPT